ncbi:sensor histidine kinase [Nocardioides mangrovicus]|uniref:Sensor histidine kinase MtrB n=1 Tax=Nocardioides mangrovicus TaxID=2478913 RepID=A0A3L8P384_9ACTN|nr:MtrAB system histidine kinase MtrB [Nocardioides mangrovicus]RLV49896.1 sensor histidine kinase [Nocardioides mangrovicus]
MPRAEGSLVGRALTVWRRSVQARVLLSVVLLSAVVVGVVGYVLLRQISGGLVDNRVRVSVAEADSEISIASNRLRQAGSGDLDAGAQLRQLVGTLVERGKVRGFDVVVVGPVAGSAPGQGAGVGTRTSSDVRAASVPTRLRTEVESDPGTAWTFTRIQRPGGGGGPGVVVGSQVLLPSDGGTYDVFLVFSMNEEQDTLGLLNRSLLTAAVLLLLLVGGLCWLVVRQVVSPIRQARQVAERISAGGLEDRMRVHGQDDLARLATSFNQMADAVQHQIRQLEELSRVQRQFVSDVSHELRTPLTTVRMAGDVLHDSRGDFDPVTARAAELLQAELDRFENLLTDLLEISRFDAGAAALELDDVDLVDVVNRVVEATAPLAAAREVRVSVTADGPCVAEADVRRVERIVRNLVSNAIDHAVRDDVRAADIEIRLGADPDPVTGAAAVSVRDYGVGLEPGQASLVFNRFWRADPARARTTGGTGLGLAIAREDARLHGGRLEAWGRPHRGAAFRLVLPRHVGAPITASPLPLVPAAAATSRPRTREDVAR